MPKKGTTSTLPPVNGGIQFAARIVFAALVAVLVWLLLGSLFGETVRLKGLEVARGADSLKVSEFSRETKGVFPKREGK